MAIALGGALKRSEQRRVAQVMAVTLGKRRKRMAAPLLWTLQSPPCQELSGKSALDVATFRQAISLPSKRRLGCESA